MQLDAETGRALCYMAKFTINGIEADEDDFGRGFDASPDTAEDYGCGDRVWRRWGKDLRQVDVCTKYGITEAEADEVCDRLEESLSFGSCGWCV